MLVMIKRISAVSRPALWLIFLALVAIIVIGVWGAIPQYWLLAPIGLIVLVIWGGCRRESYDEFVEARKVKW